MPQISASIGIAPIVCTSIATRPALARRSDPALELVERAHAVIVFDVDLRLGRALPPLVDERLRRAERADRLAAGATAAGAALAGVGFEREAGRPLLRLRAKRARTVAAHVRPMRRRAPPPGGQPAISSAAGSISAGSTPVLSATRLVSAVNSSALQKATAFGAVDLLDRKVVERHVERHVVRELDELSRDARLLGELHQVLAPLLLLDLAGAQRAAFRGRHIRREAARRSSGRCRARPARCRSNRRPAPAARSSFPDRRRTFPSRLRGR